MLVSACGWVLSVLRAPSGTGVYSLPHTPHRPSSGSAKKSGGTSSSGNAHTLATSCVRLADNGLDDSLGELLLIVHMSSVEDVVAHLGIDQYAAKVRAINQLKNLYAVWVAAYYPEVQMLGGSTYEKGASVVGGRYSAGAESYEGDSMCANLLSLLERNCLDKGTREGR